MNVKLIVKSTLSTRLKQYGVPTRHLMVDEGQLGELSWIGCENSPHYVRPLVLWDADPRRAPTEADFGELEIVGVETKDGRLMLASEK